MRGATTLNFRFADFEINVARQELRRAGAIVHIEPQVFDLLVHLIRNRDRIVSKDELIDVIWQGRIVSEATLSSRISAARRALGGTRRTSCQPANRRRFPTSHRTPPGAIQYRMMPAELVLQRWRTGRRLMGSRLHETCGSPWRR